MNELHADDLMREIEAAADVAGPEPTFPHLEIQRLVPQLREYHSVEPRPPLIGRTRYERLWVRINRVVRRVATHAVEPVVTQQNEFNTALLESLEGLIKADVAVRGAVTVLRSERIAGASGRPEAEEHQSGGD